MAKLLIDDRDQKFVLFKQLEIGKLSESKLYADFDEEVYTGAGRGPEACHKGDDAYKFHGRFGGMPL